MARLFENVRGMRPGRSVFDLSHEKKFSADMGLLIPILAMEVVPGDTIKLGVEAVLRMSPAVAPVLHEINCYIHYFGVSYRILDPDWEDFITGGAAGNDAYVLPRWTPAAHGVGSLWDYFGFPDVVPLGALPIDYIKRAYNKIYNDFYRDENLISEIDITTAEAVQKRAWEKDYFTSCLPWQQRGTSPAIPITGSSSAVWDAAHFLNGAVAQNAGFHSGAESILRVAGAQGATNAQTMFNDNTVNLGTATPIAIDDLRLNLALQRWMERNARAGSRYVEFLQAHFGVSPKDSRMQRPVYIGGMKSPVIISEVLQTSESNTTSLGEMAGHGLAVNRGFVGQFNADEYGIIIGIMSIMPRTLYEQGINRQWLRTTRYDFYHPEFAQLSEQEVLKGEIYATGVAIENTALFGFQGRYDELRYMPNQVMGLLRTDPYDTWTISRQFGAQPSLNQTFIECTPRKDFLAVPAEPAFVCSVANLIKAIRPLPAVSNPELRG